MKNHRISVIRGTAMTAAFILLSIYDLGQAAPAAVPSSADATAQAVRELQDQVRQLRSMVETMRAENAQSTSEMHQLRQDLQATRALLEPSLSSGTATTVATGNTTPTSDATTPVVETSSQKAPSIDDRVQKLEESTSLMGSKIDEQYQTKVETASKYRARLHGIVLMNAFRNVGSSDNLDFPTYADPVRFGSPTANMGATLRQSEIGLEIFGPNVAGAKTSADIQFDFSGGLPATGNGVDFGVVRMQTASLRFDWQKTSVVAGQDSLFISPLSPTSFASLATPAFAFAGNLWAWTPQIRVEHRFLISDRQTISLQAGIVDNLDWEPPYNGFYRTPQAGELSGQPAYAFRTAWSRSVQDRALRFGVAGYYGRQNWRWDRKNDAWAGMADWQIPISSRLELKGEFYRGRAIGGLGGAIGTSIVYGGDPTIATSPIRGLDTAGGWAQLKFQLTPKVELNGVVAADDAFTKNIRGFAVDKDNFGPILGRNQGALGNVVFRPRSDLVMSAELRRFHTFPVYSMSSSTNQVNLSVGILF